MTWLYLPDPTRLTGAPVGSNLQQWLYSVYLRITTGIKWNVHNNNVNTTLLNNTLTQLPFSTIVTDSLGGMNTNGTYTIKNPGTYRISACAQLNLTVNTLGVSGGGYPSPPFLYTLNNGGASVNVPAGNSIALFNSDGMTAGMAIGFVCNGSGTSSIIIWYTIASVPTTTSVTLTTIGTFATNHMTSQAPVYAVASPVAPSITSSNISYRLSIYQNSNEVKAANYSNISIGAQTLEVTKNIECNINDVIAIYATQTSGNPQSIIGDSKVTYFQGSRIN